MLKRIRCLLIKVVLLLLPLNIFAQDNSEVMDAITELQKEVKRLVVAEGEQRASDIKLLQEQIRNFMVDLRNTGGASYGVTPVSMTEFEHYKELTEELESLVTQMQGAMKSNAQPGQNSPKTSASPLLEKLIISGQIRFREEINKQNFAPGTDVNDKGFLRSRLGLKFQPIQNVTAFLQLQDSRTFGVEGVNTLANSSNIDLHQGYIQLDNIFSTQGLSLKVGRQEIAFGGQRLIGTVGWHNVGRSFDGGRLAFSGNGVKSEIWTAKLAEIFDAGEGKDNTLYGFDLAVNKNASFVPRGYLILERNNNTNDSGVELLSRNTLGFHAKGKVSLLDYEIESALQTGRQESNDISAFLAGISAGYTFPIKSKLRLAVGYDHLSGNDGDTTVVKVFNTLYATNHKFYGFMDYFLNIPVHTRGFGLRDFMIKSSFNISTQVVGKADFHLFNYAEKDEVGQTSLGKEVDLTVVYKFLKPVKLVSGASVFFPGEVFKRLQGNKLGVKFYSMMILNF